MPGPIPSSCRLEIPKDVEQRRFDGHLGRYDPTVSPQIFIDVMPWMGLILRQTVGEQKELAEFLPLHQHWVSTSRKEGSVSYTLIGPLQDRITQLVWKCDKCADLEKIRPELWKALQKYRFIRTDIIQKIKSIHQFEMAVDEVSQLQRDLRVLAAGVLMAELILEQGQYQSFLDVIPEANEDFIGFWANGLGAEQRPDGIRWLLRHRVPAFIAHRLTSGELVEWKINPKSDCMPSFMSGTDVEKLHHLSNPFDLLAYNKRNDRDSTGGAATGYGHVLPEKYAIYLPYDDCIRSSSRKQGWTGSLLGYHQLPAPQLPEPQLSDEIPVLPHPIPVGQLCWEYDQSRLTWIEAGPARTLIICPEPIAPMSTIKDKWTRWEFDSDDTHGYVMRKAGKMKGVTGAGLYYDRKLRRQLDFDSSVPPLLDI